MVSIDPTKALASMVASTVEESTAAHAVESMVEKPDLEGKVLKTPLVLRLAIDAAKD